MTDDMPRGIDARLVADRHPGVQALCRYFEYGHLPADLQGVSAHFARCTEDILRAIPDDSPELTVALRKMLEAKDCAVRAALDGQGG